MRLSDHKNLDLYKLNRDVINGKAHGMVLFQPRISAWFDDRDYTNTPYPAPFTGMSYFDVYRNLGCSDRLYWHYCCFDKIYPPEVKEYTIEHNALKLERVIETPVGKVNQISIGNTSNPGFYQQKWWVTCEEDLKVFTWLEKNTKWKYNHETYEKGLAESGEFGYPITMMPRVNIQMLTIDLMGMEEATYAMFDYPETVEEYFTALSEAQMRLIDEVCISPIQQVNFGDNLHCKLLPPELFCKYVLPEYQKRCAVLHKAGKFVSSHWDGDSKLLLKYARETGLDAIEALTPVPQGDVTIEEIKEGLGDEVYLMDGIPAVLFDDSYSEEELIEQTERLIRLFAPRLILGISDEMSSNGNLERVRLVQKIVDDYNFKTAGHCTEYLKSIQRTKVL